MNKLAYVKLAARIIVGSGTTTVTSSIIRNNVQPTNLFQHISVGVASVVIGSMASEATRAHTESQIDALAEALTDARQSTEDPTPDA